jgi:hypothetical protein
MEKLFDYFLKIVTLPRHFTFKGVLHAFLVVCGIAVIYLLTLRKDEEGRIEDYLQRVWKRVYQLRKKALSSHIAFINVVASAITSILDQLFGLRLLSIQSIGVSLCLAMFFANIAFMNSDLRASEFSVDHALGALVSLMLASIPRLVSKTFAPTCKDGGGYDSFRPLQCRFMNLSVIQRPNPVESGLIVVAQTYGFSCLCSSTWIVIWFLVVLSHVYREYFSLLFCVYCFPAGLRPFVVITSLFLSTIFAVAASLFTFFFIVTRLSLKKLATSTSTPKILGFLLLGCLPIPTFIMLLEILLVFIRRWVTGEQSLKEWIAVGLLVVFAMAFLVNAAFIVAPALFLSMAVLLLLHRLLWPVIERPLDKLNRVGITKHPWLIFSVGLGLIAFGLGGTEAVLKVLKFFGYGGS